VEPSTPQQADALVARAGQQAVDQREATADVVICIKQIDNL
jgi:hypothetical protein